MDERRPTYEELEQQLTEANAMVEALRRHEIDAIVGEKSVAVVRLREVEEQLDEARRIAEERARELEAFSYSVSHDLSAPLRAITGFATLLKKKHAAQLDDDARFFIDRMVIGADKMAALIDDLLKLSRVSLREICRTEIDLRPIALEIIKVLQQNNPERMVEVTIGEQLIVRADRNLTAIALTNLIRNAWKFTSKISHPFIEINATEKHDGKVFFVRDNGAGFDMSQAGRLFQPFQRLHTEAEFPGTGIGLTVVKRVIDKHGGAIWVESEPDKGTTFYFTFPQ